MDIETEPERPLSVRWALASLALSMLLASLGISIASVALPTLSEAFAASLTSTQWIILAYLLAITVAVVPAGRLGDTVGRRQVLLFGLGLFTTASLLCGLAPGLGALVAARVLQGVGAAILMALTLSAVRDAVPAERTGRAMGLLGSTSAIGTALGPSLGGLLIAGFGWRAVFLALVPVGTLGIALAARHLPRSDARESPTKSDLDLPGTVILCLTLAAYALAMTTGGGHIAWANGLLLAGALLGARLFVHVEGRVAYPLIDVAAFRNTAFGSALAMNSLVSIVMMTTLIAGPFYLAFGLELDAASVGLTMTAGPAMSALSGVPAGRVTDRFGARRIVVVGLLQMLIGTFALALLPRCWGVVGFVLGFVLLTPGYQLFLAALNTAAMQEAGEGRRGVVSGILNLARNLGFVTGASVMGAVFAYASGASGIAAAPPDAVAFGFAITFSVACALILVALGVALSSARPEGATPG